MRKKSAYLIGIKGVAMTALAIYLQEKGYRVFGSDVTDEFPTDRVLADKKILVKKGFSAANLTQKYDFVVVTGAHGGMTNPEAKKALSLGISPFMHGQALGYLMKDKEGISIAGCHGKTTTSSLVASQLMHAHLDPSYAIGTAWINDLGPAGHFGNGKYFVAEADEYMTCPLTCNKPRFLWQKPKILVMMNVEYDHPDAYASLEEVKKAFIDFGKKLTPDGTLVVCADNRNIQEILPKINRSFITYGFSPQADYRIQSYSLSEGISFMRVSFRGFDLGEFTLKIAGRHNLSNALAAGIVANLVGISWEEIRKNLKLFTGTKRRFEKIAEIDNVLLYDDYAHHPSEIQATIAAFRDWFPKRRLIIIFQPHTFSRTKALLRDFAKAFVKANLVIITDIYSSKRENFDSTISSNMLVIEANHHKKNAYYKTTKKQTLQFLGNNVARGDIVVTMGAGDIYLWHKEITALLKKKYER